jgi:hypothetical protein
MVIRSMCWSRVVCIALIRQISLFIRSHRILLLRSSVLCLENLRHFILNRPPRWLPSKHLTRPLRLTTRVQTPTNSLKARLIQRSFLRKSLLLRRLQVPKLHRFLPDSARKVAPNVLATLGESVAFGAPELSVGVACYSSFD